MELQLMKNIGIRCTICAGLSLALVPLVSLAAGSSDHLNEQGAPLPELNAKPVEKPDDTFKLPIVAPATSVAPSATMIKIERINFKGNTVIPTKDLDALAQPYVGKVISISELETLRQQLSKYYIEQGYVNSGVLLSPESSKGVIVFQVLEGKITGIRLHGMERLNDNYVIWKLAKAGDGPLYINVLRERYQLLLTDPLFKRLNARLTPDSNLGEALLDVDVERARAYQLSAFYNNYRPPSIGTEAGGLTGSVRNLSGFGDLLDATVETPALEKNADFRSSLGWHMPLGYWGTEFSLAVDHGKSSVVEQSMKSLNIQSTVNSQDVGLSQLIIESLRQKLSVGANRVSRKNTTTLMGTPYSFVQQEPNGVSNEALWRLWQEYTYRSETQVLALRSTFTFGKNNVQDASGLPSSVAIIPQNYKIWLGQAQYAHQVLENGAQVVGKYTMQSTSDRLLPLDGISIGGVNTVRGYLENQLVRDKGQVINLEFQYPLAQNEFKTSLIPFYDFGQGQNNGDVTASISSVGIAARSQWRHVNLDVAIAKKLSHPSEIVNNGGTLQDKGIHFQLSYNF
jgi:hemolysin activation/secretion protein